MYVTLLFWLMLVLPGYAIIRRFAKDELNAGLLGGLGLSCLATLAILSPISIACYLLRAPMGVFSAACIAAVLGGLIEISRRRWWRGLGGLLVAGIGIELVIIVVDAALGARVGALTGGDAPIHLARIRFLLDRGFSNLDPFVTGGHFFPIYHTNLLHALYAACAQLTGVDHVRVWFLSLPVAKLLAVSGVGYLAWAVFDRRWVGWVCALFSLGCQGPVTFVIYPNKLAPYWILPIMIGLAVRATRSAPTWRYPVLLASGSLILGQVHCLYGAFAGIAIGPYVAIVAIRRFATGHADRWRIVACLAALSAALPFLLVARATYAMSPTPISSNDDTVAGASKQFHHLDNGWIMSRYSKGWGIPRSLRSACLTGLLIAGVACAAAGPRRRDALAFLAIIATVAAVLFIPPLCTAARSLFRDEWILARMGTLLYIGFVILVPGSIACLFDFKLKRRWMRPVLSIAALLAAIPYANHQGEHYTWPAYWQRVAAPREARLQYLALTDTISEFCKQHISPGSTVLLEAAPGTRLVSIHDCFIVASRSGNVGVRNLGGRRRDLRAMLATDTEWATRRQLMRKYDIKYVFPDANASVGWLRGHIKSAHQLGVASVLFEVDLDK